jgi:hypothetical protein
MAHYDTTFFPEKRVFQQIYYAEKLGLGIGDLKKVKIFALHA